MRKKYFLKPLLFYIQKHDKSGKTKRQKSYIRFSLVILKKAMRMDKRFRKVGVAYVEIMLQISTFNMKLYCLKLFNFLMFVGC